jgi:uncharacterized membrane protein YdbT with pleckstrin-like domain
MASAGFDLMPGEKMVLFSHPHWWYFWKQVVGGLVIFGVLLLAMWAGGFLETTLLWIAGIGFILWVLDTIYEFVNWRTTRFAVTDQRVAYQSGFFRRKGVSIPLNRVNNVNFEQTMIERLLGNGTLTIESAGETGDSVFENIPDPDEVRSVIFREVQGHGDAQSERDAAALARAMRTDGPAEAQDSIEDRLAQLDRLRDSGTITDEEYQSKRADILGSL